MKRLSSHGRSTNMAKWCSYLAELRDRPLPLPALSQPAGVGEAVLEHAAVIVRERGREEALHPVTA